MIEQIDIEQPPLSIGTSVSPQAVKNLTSAWQSWPEHVRRMILHNGVKFGLDNLGVTNEPSAIGVNNGTEKFVRVNASTFPVWPPVTRDNRKLLNDYEASGRAMYSALLLIAPELVESVKWTYARKEYGVSGRGGKEYEDILAAAYANECLFRETGDLRFTNEKELQLLIEQFDTVIEKQAYQTVPSYAGEYGETLVQNNPKIATNVESFGAITKKEIDDFKKVYSGWPERYRQLIEEKGTTFVLKSRRNSLPKAKKESWEADKVYISAEEIDEEFQKKFSKTIGESRKSIDMYYEQLMFQALLATVGDGGKHVDWSFAVQEAKAEQKKQNEMGVKYSNISNYQDFDTILVDAVRFERDGEPDFIRPQARKASKEYLAFVNSEYERIFHEKDERISAERAAKYQVRDGSELATGFVLNEEPGVLTPPQKQYFQQMNEMLKLLGVTPKQFDQQFRLAAFHQIVANAESLGLLYGELTKNKAKQEGHEFVATGSWPGRADSKPHICLKARVNGKLKNSLNQAVRVHGIYPGVATYYAMSLLDRQLGVFSILPETFQAYEDKSLLNSHKAAEKLARKHCKTFNLDENKIIPAECNVLQLYAAGAIDLSELKEIRPVISFYGNYFSDSIQKFEDFLRRQNEKCGYGAMPNAAEYFHVSVKNAALTLMQNKGISGEHAAAVNAALELMDECWELATKTPKEYQQWELDRIAGEERAEIAKLAAAQREAERLAKQNAERERLALLPEAYQPDGETYQRVIMWAGRKPERFAGNEQLITGMRGLREALGGFTRAENLDIKIPVQKTLAEGLFSNEMLGKLEWAFHPRKNGMPAENDSVRQQMREAFATVYAMDGATLGMTPERLAANERLKRLVEHSPAAVIATLGANHELKQLKSWQHVMLHDEESHEIDKLIARREMRDAAYGLLASIGAQVEIPVPERAMLTTDGRILMSDEEYLPDEKYVVCSFRRDDLNPQALDAKIAEIEKSEFCKQAHKLKGQALNDYNRIYEQLLLCSVNDNGERDAFFARLRNAFAGQGSIAHDLADAMAAIPEPQEDAVPTSAPGSSVRPWFRPIDQTVAIAAHCANQELNSNGQDKQLLFCCHTTPTASGRFALVLKFYRYTQEQDGRVIIAIPPQRCRSLIVSDTLDDAQNALEAVQRHVLHMPGITRYARLDASRVEGQGGIIIPDRPIINGTITNGVGNGRIHGDHGKLYLHLRYAPPVNIQGQAAGNPVDVSLDLQYTQERPNYALARERADIVIAEIQQRHGRGDIVTQEDIDHWMRHSFEPARAAQRGGACVETAHFPQDDQTYIIGSALKLVNYPQDTWVFDLGFKYGTPPTRIRDYGDDNEIETRRRRGQDQEIRDVGIRIALHTSDPERALALRERVMKTVKFLLENERDRAKWDWLDEHTHTLNVRHRTPTEGTPHELMDATRLRVICDMAAAFESSHRPVVHQRVRDEEGNQVVTFRLQRLSQGQGTEDWFHEWDAADRSACPVVLERQVIFPPDATDAAVGEFEEKVQRRMKRYLSNFDAYSYIEPGNPNPPPQYIKTRQAYQPATVIGYFTRSIDETLSDGRENTAGASPGPRPPSNGQDGRGAGGGRARRTNRPSRGIQHHEGDALQVSEDMHGTFAQRLERGEISKSSRSV